MKIRAIQDQLRMQIIAHKRALKLIGDLKAELQSADQEILDVQNRIKFWIDHAAWIGNSFNSTSYESFTRDNALKESINDLSERDKGLLSSILITILAKNESLESVLYRLIENQSSAIIGEYNTNEGQLIRLNLN